MARPLRIEYPNACYHVINRGNRKERIFFTDSDYEFFIEKLSEFSDLFGISIHCYCLMPNHFHLMLTTKTANLSKFMQSLLTSYTISINNKYQKPGHLFQGRYKAQLVDSELYKNDLSRYIHLNPVKIKTNEKTSLSKLKIQLHSYKWSSFRCYIGIQKKPDWLDRNFVLFHWGKSSLEKMNNYRKFVEEGLLTDNHEVVRSNALNIIGSDSFKDKIIRKYLVKDLSDIDVREQPILLKVNEFSVKEIITLVAEYFKLNTQNKITNRQGCRSSARNLALYLAGKYCRKNNSLTALANEFNITLSGFNIARHRFGLKLKSDNKLQLVVRELEELILSSKMK